MAIVLLLTPPFTQLNTPYPATAYLKGFLNTKDISSFQADLGIEVTLKLFSKGGLREAFDAAEAEAGISENAARIHGLSEDYLRTIDPVIRFLQGKDPSLAHLIASRTFLPEASRFGQLSDLSQAFGAGGLTEKAKHIATMYLEDLADFIRECADPHFGFSRYAERLGRSANSFDELHNALGQEYSLIDRLLIQILSDKIASVQPALVLLSVPFPGNLFAALRCGQWIKEHHPHISIAMGGGFPNTELRSLSDPRVFEYTDYITLDDGEAPVERLLKYVSGDCGREDLKRTFLLIDGAVHYMDAAGCADYKGDATGTPDYSDLLLDRYISAIEIVNPMHNLWSDGRWNKLTMAHGCYWGKCTFCDVSLDYIARYEPLTAGALCDKMETLIAQTGTTGFHFVDEAAPPALMRDLALEIIRRGLTVTWWTNIRFEKSFTRDLCILLKASGCIAVSGGLEVASDRLLRLIKKGITVAQVAQVTKHFTEAGIMVHAYLMYGFPTQTAQETVDSLEMVRQMFAAGILQSAFWHQFAMTAHSPVGLSPAEYGVISESIGGGTFANNDLVHSDPSGTDHEAFSFGLKKSLHNFMQASCLDFPLQKWFDFKVPRTSVPADFIPSALLEDMSAAGKPSAKVVYLGRPPLGEIVVKSKKGATWEKMVLTFRTGREDIAISVDVPQGKWLFALLENLAALKMTATLQAVQESYDRAGLEDFELFWLNKPVSTLHRAGLLRL